MLAFQSAKCIIGQANVRIPIPRRYGLPEPLLGYTSLRADGVKHAEIRRRLSGTFPKENQ
jgi:hypothetical protein